MMMIEFVLGVIFCFTMMYLAWIVINRASFEEQENEKQELCKKLEQIVQKRVNQLIEPNKIDLEEFIELNGVEINEK